MTIRYDGPRVHIEMDQYVRDLLDGVPDDMSSGEAITPAAQHLFDINEDDKELLDQETADVFHSMVAKFLFLAKWARPDLLVAVSFLCTRVKAPSVDDYKKLR